MTCHPLPSSSVSRRRAAGLSLVELMVAMAVGFLILAAMLSAYSSGSSTNAVNARYAEVQTNGRYAIDHLRRAIQHAGFFGLTRITFDSAGNPTNAVSDGTTATIDALCGGSFVVTNVAQWIWGTNDAKTLSCIDDADYARGDVLVLRRAGLTTATTLAANNAYARSDYGQLTRFVGTSAPSSSQLPYEDYPLQVDIYYVSPWTNSATEVPLVPALKRLTLVGSAFTSQVIATGIEHMEIQYGVQDSAGAVTYLNAGSVAATDWPNVVAVRLWLLARASDPQYEGFKNTSSYAMGDLTADTAYTVNDNYVRQLFPLVVQLRK